MTRFAWIPRAGAPHGSPRLAGRTAAVLFVGAGLISIPTYVLPANAAMERSLVVLVGLVAIDVGAVAWLVPW